MEWDNVTLGNRQVSRVTLGNITVWEEGGDDGEYVIISPTALTVSSGYSVHNIAVTASTSDWTMEHESWMYATENQDGTVTLRVYQNTTEGIRDGYLDFYIYDIRRARLRVSQDRALKQAFPSEFSVESEVGDWAFGYLQEGDEFALAVIYRYTDREPSNTISYDVDADVEYDDAGDMIEENVSQSGSISPSSRFTYNGNTYIGEIITYFDNLSWVSVNNFTVV